MGFGHFQARQNNGPQNSIENKLHRGLECNLAFLYSLLAFRMSVLSSLSEILLLTHCFPFNSLLSFPLTLPSPRFISGPLKRCQGQCLLSHSGARWVPMFAGASTCEWSRQGPLPCNPHGAPGKAIVRFNYNSISHPEICRYTRTRCKSICRLGVNIAASSAGTQLSPKPRSRRKPGQQMTCGGASEKPGFGSKGRILKSIFVSLPDLDGETPIVLQPTNATEKTQLIGDSHRSYRTDS